MGIKDYLKHIDQEIPQLKSREYDYVYMDSNYMIHYLIYKCKKDTDLYSKLFDYWDYLMSVIKIKKQIYLIFDGEYDTDNALENPKYQTHLLRSKQKIASDEYDKQSIYPGSKILKTFREFFVDIIERYKKINRSNIEIIINGDDVKGEADTKILNTIYNSNQDNICICSKDSDMILIGHSLCMNKIIHIDILSNLRPIKFINIEQFKKYDKDYVLMVLLLGNDYLPKISNIKYNNLIEYYDKFIKFNKSIIIEDKINYNNLVEYITYIIINSNKKKIKLNLNNINPSRFEIYINNLDWCLKYYKVIKNNKNYIQELTHSTDEIKLKNVINIYNFIPYNYTD